MASLDVTCKNLLSEFVLVQVVHILYFLYSLLFHLLRRRIRIRNKKERKRVNYFHHLKLVMKSNKSLAFTQKRRRVRTWIDGKQIKITSVTLEQIKK